MSKIEFGLQKLFNLFKKNIGVQLIVFTIIFLTSQNILAQRSTLFPDADWLQDVHFPGTVYAGIPGPLMPSVQAHLEGREYMFHLKKEVDEARPLIDAVHAQGKKYWVNLDGAILEGNVDSVINDNQGITDPNFGAFHSLEGNLFYTGDKVLRNINRSEWRNFLISCIKRAIDAGADGSQHDAGGTSMYNSFDDEELSGFTQYVQDKGISTGDWNTNSMNFKEYLISKGKNDSNVFENDSDPQNIKDLVQSWYDFKAVNTQNSWQMLKDSCKSYAASQGKDYTIALNAGSAIGTRFGQTYFVSDYAIGEFFSWGNLFPYNDILAARSKIFEAYGKRFICWSSPTLEDIAQGDPNIQIPIDIQKEAVMHQVATLYASGGLPQLGYPADQIYPAYFLAQVNREILNSVSSAGEIGVVMSHAQTIDDNRGFEGLVAVLQDLNRSFKVLFFKSNRLNINDDLILSDLTKFKVIFLPEVYYLTDNQRTLLLSYISNGGTVVAIRGNVEYSGWVDENGDPQTNTTWANLANETQTKIKTYGLGKFINIAHNILENGYPSTSYGFDYIRYKRSNNSDEAQIAKNIIDTVGYWIDQALPQKDVYAANMPSNLQVFKYQDTTSNHYVFHLLSDSVEIPSRMAIPVSPFTIELKVAQCSYNKTLQATLYTIDNPYGISLGDGLQVDQQTGRVSVNIPQFSRWGFIDLKESLFQSNLKLSNLQINGLSKPYKLPSKSEAKVTWNLDSGTPSEYQIEVWTNLQEVGSPILDNTTSITPKITISNSSLNKANKIFSKTFSVQSNSEYIIPAEQLHDSTVYFLRLRAIAGSDTSTWTQQFFYRNSPPAAPGDPHIYVSHQNLWYFWDGATHLTPPDTSSNLVYSFAKGCDSRGCYGGDFEMDTLLYGAVFYTDSLTGKKNDVPENLYVIDTIWTARYAFNEGDALTDSIYFSNNEYENFGVYFRPISTDGIDKSDLGTIYGLSIDRHNDPPNEFKLISPENNSYTQVQIPFSWKNNLDPDPFNKDGKNINKVEIFFDSVSTFDSPGLKSYGRVGSGSEFEVDTIILNLPPNYFQAEGLLNYNKIYWKVKMWDYDRDAAEGGGKGQLSRESTDIYTLYIGNPPAKPATPVLIEPVNTAKLIPIDPNLKWNQISGAQSYKIAVCSDSTFQKNLLKYASNTNQIKISGLENDTKYFWKIKAVNGGVESDWSQVWKFKTIIALPEKLVLQYPVDKSVIASDSVIFSWNKSFIRADKYWFEYSSDSTFKNSIIDSSLTDTTNSLKAVLSNNQYWWRVKGKNEAGWGMFSDIYSFSLVITNLNNEGIIPDHFDLSQNYPNPFNPTTLIEYQIPKNNSQKVSLRVYDVLGKVVAELINEKQSPGNYKITFNGQSLSSGIYFYKLQAGSFIETKKMILVK